MFTGFNAQQDGWSLIALVDIAPGTTVYFSTNAWNPASGFAPGGGFERWVSGPSAIRHGTVLQFQFVDDAFALAASAGTLSRVVAPGSTHLGLGQVAGTLYVYQGIDATSPAVFVTALSNGGFASEVGSLAGTGLEAGATATALAEGTGFAAYGGQRNALLTATAYRALLSAPANWTVLSDGSYALLGFDGSPFAVDAVPEPPGMALFCVSAAVIWLCRPDRRRSAIRLMRQRMATRLGHGRMLT